jgi:recombination protein RecA
MPRERLEQKDNAYFQDRGQVSFIKTGSTLLDLALGGGWAQGRVVNLVGDKSTGKTLLAIEATINFLRQEGHGKAFYVEAEAAFDEGYAGELGMPLDEIEFIDDIITVEKLFSFIDNACKKEKDSLIIVDSLDALSDEAEMERDIDKGSFGAAKAKMLSQLFRRCTKQLSVSNNTLFIISQIRDKMNVTFGETKNRSGGHALDFYATQVAWLAQTGKIYKEKSGQKRALGVNVLANVKKNKVGAPFRQAAFPIYFGYGVEDALSCHEFLKSAKALGLVDLPPSFIAKVFDTPQGDYDKYLKKLRMATRATWFDIEDSFAITRKKY